MFNVLLFAGTTEGRRVAEFLNKGNISTYVCVTTEYGEELLPKGENIKVSHERLDQTEMINLIKEIDPDFVVDGTHPYAALATENIVKACKETGKKYIRVLRNTSSEVNEENSNAIYFKDVDEAVEFLKDTEGNILVTTGSKEIDKYTRISNFKERVFARVLSLPSVAEKCSQCGFEGKNLICMQGPFSTELNAAMLKQFNCKYIVTKMSGKTGGYEEKLMAAEMAGATPVIIGKPLVEEGISVSECIKELSNIYKIETEQSVHPGKKDTIVAETEQSVHPGKKDTIVADTEQSVHLVGIGTGNSGTLTFDAAKSIENADLLIGATRMVESVKRENQDVFIEYNSEKIKKYIEENPQYQNIAVLLSGDTGFYSGAKKLIDLLEGYKVELIPGISSVVYFMAKIKKSWDDVCLTSSHGRQANLIDQIRTHQKVFSILGSKTFAGEIALELNRLGMGNCKVFIGENLSYENEKIISGTAEEMAGYVGDALSVIYVENPDFEPRPATHGIKDEEFLRAKVPMTKEEVRSVSLSKLHLNDDSVCYDIGAGTGSVSIEMALRVTKGKVIAIEKKPEAVELIKQNRDKFKLGNLEVIEGEAPEALKELETPTHAFIGGSSGNMKEILTLLLEKNPEITVVINCIALETVGETINLLKEFPLKDVDVIQLQVSRAKELGRYHLMMGENPITIISFKGEK